jgi:oligoribonuclease
MPEINEMNLIWIDLEMTGLDTDNDEIIEIATVVTDSQLNELAEGPVLAIGLPESRLEQMDDWNRNQHSKSGLWKRVVESKVTLAEAEEATLDFLRQWVPERKSPMCGNSICQDRRFLHRQMPTLEQYFHYRNYDVSSLKEMIRRWQPSILDGYKKGGNHLALDDIRDSITELQHYRQYMGHASGLPQ